MPRVKVLAVGSTMAAQGNDTLALARYVPEFSGMGQMPVSALVSRVPEAARFATLEADQDWSQLAPPMPPMEQWTSVARRLQHLFDTDADLAGALLIHGTNVLEETAYLLHLVLKTEKPVVVLGAQRPITGLSTDGPLNLVNAVRVAVSADAVGRGVMVVLNDTIHSARHVTKGNTYRLQTFHSPGWGPIGYVDPDRVSFSYVLGRTHTTRTRFSVDAIGEWPRVDILYGYHGVDGSLVEAAVGFGARGLVIAGSGGGGVQGMQGALEKAIARGIAVVRGSRTGSGRVLAEDNATLSGAIAAGDLHVQKARVLLQLSLMQTNSRQELQEIFDTY